MFLFSEEYNIALEMLEPVEEVALGQGMRVLLSDDAKAAKDALKEARNLRKKGDTSTAKKKYQEAINKYQKLKTTASKIEDDDAWDLVAKLFVMPMVVLVTQTVYAYKHDIKVKYKDMTKASTMAIIQQSIDCIKGEMNKM